MQQSDLKGVPTTQLAELVTACFSTEQEAYRNLVEAYGPGRYERVRVTEEKLRQAFDLMVRELVRRAEARSAPAAAGRLLARDLMQGLASSLGGVFVESWDGDQAMLLDNSRLSGSEAEQLLVGALERLGLRLVAV